MAVAGATAATCASGSAAAFTGQPGAYAAPRTLGPDLVGVRLDPANRYGAREAATFCFDEPLRTDDIPVAFSAMTYDAGRFLRGQSTQPARDPKCVLVTFDPVVDLNRLGSIGTVDANGVRGVDGRPNLPSSAPLEGSALRPIAGRTTAPDLIRAAPRASDDTVAFTFDGPFDRSKIDLAAIGLAVPGGRRVEATDLVEAGDMAVRVRFPPDTPVTRADAFFVRAGAVQTLPFDGLSGGSPLDDHRPSDLAVPGPPGVIAGHGVRLVKAWAPTGGHITVEYSTEPGELDPQGLLAVRDNGQVETAVSVARVGRPTTRAVAFDADGAVARDPAGIVALVSQSSAQPSAIAVGPGAPATPGLTNGPDLIATAFDPVTSLATFTYDEPISSAAVGVPDRFSLLAGDGSALGGIAQGPAAGNDRSVLIGYPGGTGIPAGVAAAPGAVSDPVGNRQPLASVSVTARTPAMEAAASVITVPARLTLRRSKGPRTFTGRLTTQAPCRRRVVRVGRGTKRIASARSRATGRFTAHLLRRTGGPVRARVAPSTVVRGGVVYACAAAGSAPVAAHGARRPR